MHQTPQNAGRPTDFEAFDPVFHASLSLNYLTKMTDASLGYLPYWLVSLHNGPAFAEHCRVDDAELVASWYEGLSCAREILQTSEGADVEQALLGKLLSEGWDTESGFRFPVKRPWSAPLTYCTFHEMAYVLSALNRACLLDPDNDLAEARASGLVAGLRRVVTDRRTRALWCGVREIPEKCYSFPCDVYVMGLGFDSAVETGFGDGVLRNATLIAPLMDRFELRGDRLALELAEGLANYLTIYSHYFNYRMEFYGHVHSALWTAYGLAKLGRLTANDRFVAKGKGIYDYVRRYSSAFGWVPEYIQWQLLADEVCEGSCIKDMMICALELVDCGFPEYWDDVHRFWRNHLAESQISDTSFILEANGIADSPLRTYSNMASRIRGGVTGASMPNLIDVRNFRAVSGSSSAMAPVGMLAAWKRVVEINRSIMTVNFPVNCDLPSVRLSVGYPRESSIGIKLKKDFKVMVRVYPWMTGPYEGTVDNRTAGLERRDDLVIFGDCKQGMSLKLNHEAMKTRRIMENVGGIDFFGMWRGPDMVDILQHGTYGYRLYQRAKGFPRELPSRSHNISPDRQQINILTEPQQLKETRLNRRRAPRV